MSTGGRQTRSKTNALGQNSKEEMSKGSQVRGKKRNKTVAKVDEGLKQTSRKRKKDQNEVSNQEKEMGNSLKNWLTNKGRKTDRPKKKNEAASSVRAERQSRSKPVDNLNKSDQSRTKNITGSTQDADTECSNDKVEFANLNSAASNIDNDSGDVDKPSDAVTKNVEDVSEPQDYKNKTISHTNKQEKTKHSDTQKTDTNVEEEDMEVDDIDSKPDKEETKSKPDKEETKSHEKTITSLVSSDTFQSNTYKAEDAKHGQKETNLPKETSGQKVEYKRLPSKGADDMQASTSSAMPGTSKDLAAVKDEGDQTLNKDKTNVEEDSLKFPSFSEDSDNSQGSKLDWLMGDASGSNVNPMSPSSNSSVDTIDFERDIPENKPSRKHKEMLKRLKMKSQYSISDTRVYREGYPTKRDIPGKNDNKEFYFNKLISKPDGGLIEEILRDWKGDYKKLERHHGYIQWLFPIREKGMNIQSQELQLYEAEAIKKNKAAHERVVRAYELMLDFYGLELVDKKSGKLERATNWRDRFDHLNSSFHNYLRITRILKCLGELGYEHYKAPLIRLFVEESIVNGTLPNCAKSCMDFWVHTIKDVKQRKLLVDEAKAKIDQVCKDD